MTTLPLPLLPVSYYTMSEDNPTLDLRGLRCPLPVLRLRKYLKDKPQASQVRVIVTDPAAVIDIPHFCQEAGHRLLSQETFPDHLLFTVQKG